MRTTGVDFDVIIVGSGFAGLCLAIHLKKSGMGSFLILEKSDDVGGTWRDNTYPGCVCDIPAHLYSFSFAPSTDWNRMLATQPEIRDYIHGCVDRYGLRPSIRFNCEMRESVFDEEAQLWRIRTLQGDTFTTRVLVSAMGGFSRPSTPQLPGLESFKGKAFHSASWDHSYDLHGKRVAVFGTGTSALQFIPQIAPQVGQLHLFQRTPPWIVPRKDRRYPAWERFLFKWLPGYRWMVRQRFFWELEMLTSLFTGNDPGRMKPVEKAALLMLEQMVPDAELRARITPNYVAGCKRLVLSNDYLPVLSLPHVELVTDDVSEVREHSIVTRDGRERKIDALIFGTGFRVTEPLAPVRFVGRNGLNLDDAWRDGGEAYLGMTVAGYPNLFIMVGPNSGPGNNSMIATMEAQVNYIMQGLTLVFRRGVATMEVRADVQARFIQKIRDDTLKTVWASGCKNWYHDVHGKNTTLWPGFFSRYRLETLRLKPSDYTLCRNSGGAYR